MSLTNVSFVVGTKFSVLRMTGRQYKRWLVPRRHCLASS